MLFRGEISEGQYAGLLKALDYAPTWRGKLLAIARRIPPISDMIRFAVREVYSPDVRARFGQDDDYPEAFTAKAALHGLSEEDAKAYWAAHWELPSTEQGFRMFHRSLIDKPTLELLLRAKDIMPFWRDKGLTGQVVSENGPVKVTFDTSPEKGVPGVMMGFIGGHEARVWQGRPLAERRDAVLQQFAHFFGDEALSPTEVVEFNWSAEVWNRGCPVAVLGPGTLIDFGEALRQPVERIHWAGTETSTYWNGYMDGAVRSGRRAASEVLAAL